MTLGPNTWLERDDNEADGTEVYVICFHRMDIIRFRSDGSVRLYSGGHRTTTTKQRINALSPVQVHQVKHIWYVGEREFTEGIEVGNPLPCERPDDPTYCSLWKGAVNGDTLSRLAMADYVRDYPID